MSSCDRAVDWLLEADPAVLRGQGSSEDAAHVRSCPSCSALADQILESQERLHAALGATKAEPDFDAILARASMHTGTTRVRPLRRGRLWRRWVPLAAAAVLATVWLIDREPVVSGTPIAPALPSAPLVESSGGRDVAVIATGNPDITVLWFF